MGLKEETVSLLKILLKTEICDWEYVRSSDRDILNDGVNVPSNQKLYLSKKAAIGANLYT